MFQNSLGKIMICPLELTWSDRGRCAVHVGLRYNNLLQSLPKRQIMTDTCTFTP